MGRHSKPDPLLEDSRHRRPTEIGYHRAVMQGKRGVAKWLIGTLAAIFVVALGGIAFAWGSNALNTAADAAATCAEGRKTLQVVTTPSLADRVRTAAEGWNATDRDVHDRCIDVTVGAKNSATVLDTLRDPAAGKVPAVWIPESTTWPQRLADARPERISSTPTPVVPAKEKAYQFVVLGGTGVDEIEQRAAHEFRSFLLESEIIR